MTATRWRPLSLLLLTALAVVGAVVAARPAGAGGASWVFERASYAPGDTAVGRTAISWAHNPTLGGPEDGPFDAYLVPIASYDDVTAWPTDPAALPGAVPVAQVVIREGPVEERPGLWVGPNHATVTFEVPDLPDGHYRLDQCNRPCTKPLADITGGGLWIGPVPPEVRTPAVVPAPAPPANVPSSTVPPSTVSTTTMSEPDAHLRTVGRAAGDQAGAPVESATGGSRLAWALPVVALLSASALTTLAARRRRRASLTRYRR